MLGKSGDYAKTGKLIVTVAAVAADPTGLAAAGATLDGYLHLHEELTKKHPELAKLTKELDRDLRDSLKNPTFHCPQEAGTLLPQMIEAALPSGDDFTECGLDANLILERLVGGLTSSDHTKPDMITAFRSLYGPILHRACNDPRLSAALDPALTREQMRRQREQSTNLKEILNRLGGLEGAINNAENASLDDLNKIARQFGAETFDNRAPLVKFLALKAEDYHKLRTEVETIKGLSDRIDNIYGAAVDAIENIDFDTAEDLIQNAKEIHHDAILRPALETNAKLLEKEAEIALLRGRVNDAYTIFSAAADSFVSISPLESVKHLFNFEVRLYEHSLRFGGEGLNLAIAMTDKAIALTNPKTDALLWAQGKNNLGNALQMQGTRTAGETGTTLLAEAVSAFRDALKIYTHVDHPLQWAMTQNNIGNTLANQGIRTGGEKGITLLTGAVSAYHDALSIRTREDHPVEWAMTQSNLGNALRHQGTQIGGDAGAALLADAVVAYRSALTIRTREDHPTKWAMTQNNLGNTLTLQGISSKEEASTVLLAQAATAYRNALTIHRREDHPVQWAMTQNNLGIVILEQANRRGDESYAPMLAEAAAAFGEALTVRTRKDHPADWAMTKENLALCELSIANGANTADPLPHLEKALEHVEAALTVFDADHMPYNFEKATDLRDRIKNQLDSFSVP